MNPGTPLHTASQVTGIRDIARKCFELAYKDIAPVNLTLCLLILPLNGLVLAYYRHKLTTLTPVLFFCIAVCDTLAAVGSLLFATGVMMWTHEAETNDHAMWWFYVLYRAVGLLGYSTAIFLNTLLAVTRTIQICYPFYQPRILAMKVFTGAFFALLVGLTVYDLYFLANLTREKHFMQVIVFFFFVVSLMASTTFPGQALAWHLYVSSGFNTVPTAAVHFTLLTVIYFLPVLVVLMSATVQVVVVVRRSQARRDNEETINHFNDWRHINTTIILLASLFFVCNGALTVDSIVVQLFFHGPDVKDVEYRVFGTLQTVLPLLSSLLSPVILISRNSRMRQDLTGRVRGIFSKITGSATNWVVN